VPRSGIALTACYTQPRFQAKDASHRVADNPRISKSIDLGRTTTRYPCGAYFKSPEMSLRFAYGGVEVHLKKGRPGFGGNLGGGWVVARRGRGFGEKCGVVALRKDRGTNARKPEPRKWPAWKAGDGLPRLTAYPKGWRSLAEMRGCGLGERPRNGCPETGTAEMAGVESWGTMAAVDRLPGGVAVFG